MGYNPNYKWIKPTYPIYNWGYNPLTKWDEPPSTNQSSKLLGDGTARLGVAVVGHCPAKGVRSKHRANAGPSQFLGNYSDIKLWYVYFQKLGYIP